MADTSPSGEAKTCAGPLPPVLVDEIAPLNVPLSKMVKDWIAPASTSLTALKIWDTSATVINAGRLSNVLEDGWIHDASLNPSRILPRRVLLGQR